MSSPRVPRHIANLNALAEQHGLAVQLVVEPYTDNPELRLWARWSGPRAAFLDLVQPVASYRLPLSRGTLNVPGGAGHYSRTALVSGVVTVEADNVVFEIDFGAPEVSIEQQGDVEIARSANEITYHGTSEGLIAVGIPRERLPTGKRPAKGGYCNVLKDAEWYSRPEWHSRRQPDGSILYRIESPAAVRQRVADVHRLTAQYPYFETAPAPAPRPQLRLVVDNSREPQL
jgi:hypothetical protein